ncbi:MAG TPA: glycosyltransferase family 4 protein [Lacunisphaera sp.]|nr:glycosyltransferase family 4 protein [Lacunisphaera sp.]
MSTQPATTNDPPRVLFLGHDASRTGAPLLLLALIRWLRAHSDVIPSVVLLAGGEMETQYRELAATARHDLLRDAMNRGLGRKVLRHLGWMGLRTPDLAASYPPQGYPVVYANTIATLPVAAQLAGPGRRVVLHVHELAYTTDYYAARELLRSSVAAVDVYIAASHAVREFLATDLGIPAPRIQVIHDFPVVTADEANRERQRTALRRQLGISDEAFVVGMCGWPQWRKGVDLFVQLADHLQRSPRPVACHCVWVGGDRQSQATALHDVAKLGLQRVCHFVPAVSDPAACFSAFDLFALTSREDPFSVAMLEAADHRLPVICFAQAGGAPELVEEDAGVVVPYLNISAMAKACVDLMGNDVVRHRLGENARAKVRSRYSLDVQGPKFLDLLRSLS